ncbi:MAG: hypothetical protein ALECFALPRED_003213 [Alectoria fallacina]|uniref:Uncharacterized protein n=1 Tax=Alectoria fallacina TaxID=1903189 RepID=A0A8H3INN2_9LECA|nr:MAG: hypothetical protein ALECFALPRED_003213 [Alectoria fallacina]
MSLNVDQKTSKAFLKGLHRRREKWKATHTKNNNRATGSDIVEPADMLEFLKYCELDRVSPYTEEFLNSILDGDDNIRLVDTAEFAGYFLVQFSIRDARGNLLFKRTVDHEMTVKELYETAVEWSEPIKKVLVVLKRFYGAPSRKPTRDCKNTSTLISIFKELEQDKIIQPQYLILEYSMSRCDYRHLYAAAEKAGFTHLMPPLLNSVLCITPLRRAMPGLFSSLVGNPVPSDRSEVMSGLLCPKDSDEDTSMLVIVLVIFALTISDKRDDFLSWWERDKDLPGGWTAGFIADWMTKTIEARPNISPLNLPAVSLRKRTLESAGNSRTSKKAKFQSDKSKPQPKKAESQSGKSKTQPIRGASGRQTRKSPPTNHWPIRKSKAKPSFKTYRLINRKQSTPIARQSSRTKGKVPKYREKIGWR